ncbi:MAG: hypothetical protein WB986_06370, partial [Methanoregula sp.]|uniref:hypothetical protein n=1 Tax=Methanoregula sp. TaxID=2052170 RepID=UPI003C50A8F2
NDSLYLPTQAYKNPSGSATVYPMTTKGGKDYRIFLPALEDPGGDRHDDAGMCRQRGGQAPI